MTTGMHRREFFKSIAIGGAVAAVAGCADKPEKLIPYLVPPDNVEFAPGIPLDYATTCMECPANCGMIVKTREARAIKAEGNPDHPLSRGALCIRGQASLQTHYNPARYAKARRRGQDGWKDISWQDAEQQFVAMLRAAGKGSIVYITGNAAGYSMPYYWRTTYWGRKGVIETSTNADHLALTTATGTQMERRELPASNAGGYFRAFLKTIRGEGLDDGEPSTRDVLDSSERALIVQAAADAGQTGVALARTP